MAKMGEDSVMARFTIEDEIDAAHHRLDLQLMMRLKSVQR